MIFLFGEQVLQKGSEEGQFYCPHCEQVRAYQLIRLKKYFSLFFIPLLPLDTFKEYLECRSCQHSYHPTVKDDRQQQPAFHYALRRILADILRATRMSEANLNLMSKAYQTATAQPLSHAQAHAALQAARDDPRDLLEYVRLISKSLNAMDLQKTLTATAQLLANLAGELPLPHEYRVMFNQIASELGVSVIGIENILQSVSREDFEPRHKP